MEVLRCVLRDFMNCGHTPPYHPKCSGNFITLLIESINSARLKSLFSTHWFTTMSISRWPNDSVRFPFNGTISVSPSRIIPFLKTKAFKPEEPKFMEMKRYTFVGDSAQLVKNPPAMWETWVRSWIAKIPWRRERLLTLVFWSGEFHGLSLWGHKELDRTEWLWLSLFTSLAISSDMSHSISLLIPRPPMSPCYERKSTKLVQTV